MEKFMKIPWYYSFFGIMIGFALIIFVAFIPNIALLFTGIIFLHIFGWILAARFFLCGIGFFSLALEPGEKSE